MERGSTEIWRAKNGRVAKAKTCEFKKEAQKRDVVHSLQSIKVKTGMSGKVLYCSVQTQQMSHLLDWDLGMPQLLSKQSAVYGEALS